jgi:hypothetical protein
LETDILLDLSRFRRPRIVLIAAAFLLSATIGIYFATQSASPPALAFSDFLKAVDAGKVTEVTFADPIIDVVLRDGSIARTVAPPEFLSANASFVTDLYRRDVRVDVIPAPEPGTLS